MRRLLVLVFLVSAVWALVLPAVVAQTPSVEEELLALMNTVRSPPVVMHAGLRAAARTHAADMAAADAISHAGARDRIYHAQPDPSQNTGPPDDGFTGTWCEVAGWEPAHADENIARRFFTEWRKKAEDNLCMTNERMTVAGLGVYERGPKWWATLLMVQDRTPPKPEARPAVAPTATPAVTPSAMSNQAGGSEASGASRSSSSTSNPLPFGWREIAVSAAGLSVAPVTALLRRRRTRVRARL